jgi:REP element-mobilizing transposase RayT
MSNLFNDKFRTKTTRLASWDYGSNGKYFVTICTDQKTPYFGSINDSNLLDGTEIGDYAKKSWESIPDHFPYVQLDCFILMPDHLHGILCFSKKERSVWQTNQFGTQTQNLGSVIRCFKGEVKRFATRQSIDFQWQARYYDRIIRNDLECDQIREYIINNPAKARRDGF